MIVDIEEFGGIDDGCTDNSKAFADAMAALSETGGGTLRIMGSAYLTGPIELLSNISLEIGKNTTLSFVSDINRYPPVLTRWEGVVCYGLHPLIFARGAKNIELKGEGTIDGNGQPWWEALRRKKRKGQNKPLESFETELAELNKYNGGQPSGGGGREIQFLRPPLVQFFGCSDVAIEGLKFQNSPFWTIHPVFSNRISIRNISIHNPSDAPNTDGIDIDSCKDILVTGSTIDVGDDCLAVKAGSGEQGISEGKSSERIVIRDCHFKQGHGGVVIGSETAGGIYEILVSDCSFDGTDRGVRIKTRRGRGGTVSRLRFSDLHMKRALCPVAINMYYRCGAKLEECSKLFSLEHQPVDALTPHIHDIEISNLRAQECRASAGFIIGLPESPIENLRMRNCRIELSRNDMVAPSESEMFEGLPEMQARGIRIRNANCDFDGLEVLGLPEGEAPYFREPSPN
ncbi:MAG: glycoside hydrolase family 28 protein [Spirochaetia bacterium]|jgi:polygalacturonase|nr:glycoside hydrolase family 28 protein [Spirochaetia bacterium]HQH88171.1 glycoside hydrolase family 28 protein [Rectinema sp.]